MRKIMVSVFVIVIILVTSTQSVYAADEGSWVSDAFTAASDFLNNGEVTDPTDGKLASVFDIFKSIIRGINIVLLVVLAGLSMISLSIIGVKYLLSGASPHRKEEAKQSLNTVFIGMLYGFGAFTIWTVAMQIVMIIINALGQSS